MAGRVFSTAAEAAGAVGLISAREEEERPFCVGWGLSLGEQTTLWPLSPPASLGLSSSSYLLCGLE